MAVLAPYPVNSGQSVSQQQSGVGMVPGMVDVYNQLLGLNQQNYNQVLGAFAQGQQTLAPQLAAVNDLFDRQRGENANLWKDAYNVAAGDIRRQAVTNQGRIQQQLINAGLGGSTVLANLSLGAERQAAQEYQRLSTGLAQQEAANRTALTNAQANAWLQGLGMRSNLYGQQGGALANYRFANTAGDLTGPYASSTSASSAAAPGGGGGGGSRGGGGGGGGSSYQPSSFMADARARADSYFHNTPGLGLSQGYGYYYGTGNPYAPNGMPSNPSPGQFSGDMTESPAIFGGLLL